MITLQDPPAQIIEIAIEVARASPCAKSKRGVCMYALDAAITKPYLRGDHNRLPWHGSRCVDGAPCRGAGFANCNKIAVHAEQGAIRVALVELATTDFRRYGMVHVKVDAMGALVAGGPPSCWQCAREILDVAMGAFFLYEKQPALPEATGQAWVRYDAEDFYACTLKNAGLTP